jgi:hypothetical protein
MTADPFPYVPGPPAQLVAVEPAPSFGQRIAVAGLIGVAVAIVTWGNYRLRPPEAMSDFDQCWIAARAILARQDPFVAVRAQWAFPMSYPLPAALAVLPLAFFPIFVARIVFVAIGASVCAFGVTRQAWHPLYLFLSGAFLESLIITQWTPLLMGAALIPAMGWLLAAKPNLGAALAAGWPNRWMALGVVLILAVSLVVWPSWPEEWLAGVREMNLFRPMLRSWLGPVILLGLLRWRRPEARMLVALACIPQTGAVHSALPLFLAAETRRQTILLALLSHVAYGLFLAFGPYPTHMRQTFLASQFALAFMFGPCLYWILRRPNEGRVFSK